MIEAISRSEYFTPGNVVTSFGGQDLVLAYTEGTQANDWHWSVMVVSVEKDDRGAWARSGYPRNHRTNPDQLSRILGRDVQA